MCQRRVDDIDAEPISHWTDVVYVGNLLPAA